MMQRLLVGLAVVVCCVAGARGEERSGVVVDHLVLGAADLDGEAGQLGAALGVEFTAGGSHPGRGTANRLCSLGEGVYLEVIGPDAGVKELPAMGRRLAELEAAELLTYAVRSDDLEAVDAAAKGAGLRTSGVRAGSRRTPEGELLEWKTLGIDPGEYGGLIPFFIDWGETAHPSETSAGSSGQGGAKLVRMVVTHPEADGLQKIYAALGIEVEVRYGNRAAIVAEIESERGRATLTGGGTGF